VLGSDDHRVDTPGTAAFVFDRYLGLAVWTQKIERAIASGARQLLSQTMGEHDG
jgi:hypothetical protein